MQINNITKFVNLKGLKITNVEEFEDRMLLSGKLFKRLRKCPHCDSNKIEVHDYRKQLIKDIPYRSKKVLINFNRKRYRCRNCNKKFEAKPEFVSHKSQMTNRLKLTIIKELGSLITIKDISKRYFVSEDTVRRLAKLITPRRLELGEVLNIDEYKGDCNNIKYQTILMDSMTKRTIDILPTRYEKDLNEYFRKIPEDERKRVKVFVSDMSPVFKNIHDRFFPDSIHLIDRYHFIRQVLWGFENVRKREQKSMLKSQRIHFKRSKSLLTKPYQSLDVNKEMNKVSLMLELNENIKDAYIVKESFYLYVLKSKSKYEASKKLSAWIDNIKLKKIKEFRDCLRAYSNWFEQICNSFDYEYSNGYVEGHNNKTKVLKRIGYGYRNFNIFRTRRLLMA